MPKAHRHTLACLPVCKHAWPDPPAKLLALFDDSGKDTLEPILKFIAKLPIKGESDNARAAQHYRDIAAKHAKAGRRKLADAFYEIANFLYG